jgi:hypothetical protein
MRASTTTARARWLAPLVVLGLVLAGCGGSSEQSRAQDSSVPSGSASSSSAPSSSASSSSAPSRSAPGAVVGPTVGPGFASTSAGTPKDVLSKPDFLISMNAVCSAVDAQLQALPAPSGTTDFDAIRTNLTGTLRIVPILISRAEALIARMPERAELRKNWIDLKRADYAAFKPIAERMVRNSVARDAAKVQADAEALSSVLNHRSFIKGYLDEFGLYSCGHLETY